MSVCLDRCAWKLVSSESFVLGINADRCGEVAAVKILRPNRKTDLFLCEHHINNFIAEWGLHNQVEILCFNYMEGIRPQIPGYSRYSLDPPEYPESYPDFSEDESSYPLEWSDICRHGRPECECGGA